MDGKYGPQYHGRIWFLWFILLLLGNSSCRPSASAANLETPQQLAGTSLMSTASTPFISPGQPVTATPLPATPPPKRPIYIVDPNDQGILSNIFMIDPDTQRIVWTIQTRFLPEAVLSPDGQRLYVADSYRTHVTRGAQQDVLSVFNAHDGSLIVDDTPIQGRLLYKIWPLTRDSFLFFSDDGRQLFIEKYGEPDIHQLRLDALKSETLQPVQEGILPPCDHRIVAFSDHWICIDNTALIEINPLLRIGGEKILLSLPGSSVMGVAFDAQRSKLYTIDSDSTVTVVNVKDRVVLGTKRLTVAAGWQIARDIVLAPDGKRLYISLNTNASKNAVFIDAIAVYNTANWDRVATITLASPIYHFALSAAGDQLYATSPNARSLAIYDTGSFQKVGLIRDLGGAPSLILIPTAR